MAVGINEKMDSTKTPKIAAPRARDFKSDTSSPLLWQRI
jgi:hypothetical protein